MSPTGSIESRLQLGLGISLVLLIAVAWWLGHQALHQSAEAYVLSRLQHDAEALLGALELAPEGGVRLGRRGIAPVYEQPFSGHYHLVLLDGTEALRSRSLWDAHLAARRLAPGETAQWRATGPEGQALLVWGSGFERQGRALTLIVAEDLALLQRPLQSFERLFALVALLGLGTMLLVQRTLLRRAFARLDPVYRDIEALEQGTATALTESVPVEILPLVVKINRLLRVYAKRLERSRHAAGNLAHALKAPLSLMVRELESHPEALTPSVRTLLSEQVERVRGLLDRELKRARLAGEGAPGVAFDPAAELPVLRRLLLGIYQNKGLELECQTSLHGVLSVDREDMLELIGTLLDNACKWCKTRVRCGLEPIPGGLHLVIEDDGPGCNESEIETIAARGARLDESSLGYGLGLSIAREIVELYGGRLGLGRSQTLGGLRAEVELPVRIRATQSAPDRAPSRRSIR